jgi:MYB-related transcription factor LHY
VEEGINEGKWTDDEHKKFLEGLKLFGKNWNLIRQHVGSRTCPQTRSHAQKFFRKLEKTGDLHDFAA